MHQTEPSIRHGIEAATATEWDRSLLDELLDSGVAAPAAAPVFDRVRRARTVGEAFRALFGVVPGEERRNELQLLLTRLIASIDELVTAQVNAILHHPQVQSLEASWRSLRYLVDCVDPDEPGRVVVRVLNCTKSELFKDLDRAIEFDQSSIFRKIYEAEFGTPGGEPFGILLGDYAMSNRLDDVQLMSGMTEIAAAAFAPFVTSPSPQLFELETFRDLPLISDLSTTFDARRNPAYIKWNALRQKEDSRFLGLVLPRMLMRRPHADDGSRVDQFIYQETLDGGIGGYLWGNAAYAFGEVVIRSYQNSGWLAGIRGMTPGTRSGGLVTQLPTHWFETDAPLIAPRCATEAIITEQQEKALSEAGFIPLCDCQDSPYAVFYSNQSVQLPKTYQEADATQNARLSAMLQYMLCVSRFAHCIKVMIRDRVGSFEDAPDIEKFLHNWIINYVTPDDDAGLETKARFPLREAQVSVRPHPENPGKYHCTVHLRPHFELDDLTASVELRTELGGRST